MGKAGFISGSRIFMDYPFSYCLVYDRDGPGESLNSGLFLIILDRDSDFFNAGFKETPGSPVPQISLLALSQPFND